MSVVILSDGNQGSTRIDNSDVGTRLSGNCEITNRERLKTNAPSLAVILFTIENQGSVEDLICISNLSSIETTEDEFGIILIETEIEREGVFLNQTSVEKLGNIRNVVGVVSIINTKTH